MERPKGWHPGLLRWLPVVLLAGAVMWGVWRTPGFLTARHVSGVVHLASLVGVLAVGQSVVLIGGGFDLSQGATLGLSAAVAAVGLRDLGWGPVAAAVAALGCGGLVGVVNGVFVAYVRANAFVTTLSMTLIVRGLTFLVLGGRELGGLRAFEPLAASLRVGEMRLSGLMAILGVVAIVGWVGMRCTVWGQHLYATGGNAEAARLAGVRTERLRLASFAVSGLAAALGGLLWLASFYTANARTGEGYELLSIAACVVGGVSLQGGRGSVLGAIGGCLLLQAVGAMINLTELPGEYATLTNGLVILVFAAVDALARRGERR
ncbi:MAG: monosaccharide-transporting ATPase [Isosphaeraceae bacterium]|jgi:ribose/xylose/arabinose/galactoside ABC-type transport system permease subunit|nr:MAG: monosaccharide-transporting ATPase [Isosphaeraceae bacterium]